MVKNFQVSGTVIRLIACMMRRKKMLLVGVFFTGTLGIIPIMALGGHQVVEAVDSAAFCAQTCHDVHYAEAVTFKTSPHSEVSCASCHVGSGAQNLVRSKLRGLEDIMPAITGNYQRPISTPLKERRPSSETCEKCHGAAKFFGDIPRVKTTYSTDESNTKSTITRVLKVGGGREEVADGIHWHSTAKVWYVPLDEKRLKIGLVATENATGGIAVYVDPGRLEDLTPERVEKGKRLMDCIDCHNRVTHLFRSPDQLIDMALTDGSIDIELPFIKREALNSLAPPNENLRDAYARIDEIREFFRASYPEIVKDKAASIDRAIRELKGIARLTTFPDNLDWNTHPDHVTHDEPDSDMKIDWDTLSARDESAGCFRCHGNLTRVDTKEETGIAEIINGLRLGTISLVSATSDNTTLNDNSSDNASVKDASSDNRSSISISANASFKNAGYDNVVFSGLKLKEPDINGGGPGRSKLDAECNTCHYTQTSPLTSPLAPATSHPIDGLDDCLICHSPSSAQPFKTDHPWSTNEACNTCHQSASKLKTLPLSKPPEKAADTPHSTSKLEDCLVCHSPTARSPISKDHPWSTNDTCTSCHKPATTFKPLPAAMPPEAKDTPHSTSKLESCLSCHAPSAAQPFKTDHPWSTNETCTTCHKPASAPAPLPPSVAPAGSPVRHPVSGLSACSACHNQSGPAPFPVDHGGRPDSFCAICHKPAGGTVTQAPSPLPLGPAIKHSVSGLPACSTCHSQSGGVAPFPATHAGRPDSFCLICHKTAPATPAPAKPATPASLTATASSATQVNLSWVDNANNEGGFRIERATNSAFTTNLVSVTVAANTLNYSDITVSANTTYYFRILAFNSSGNSPASNIVSVTTPAPSSNIPAAPTSLTTSTVNNTQVNLTWVDNASNESGFTAQRATNNTFTADLVTATTTANTTSYNATGLSASTTYYFRVLAYNSSGNSAPSNISSATTLAPPINAGVVYATNCAVCHGTNRQGGAGPAITTSALSGRTEPWLVSFISSHNTGTNLSSAETSALAQWLKAPVTIPAAPTSLTATASSATQVNLSWVDNAINEGGFRIERATNSTFTADLVSVTVAANTLNYTDITVSANTTYYFRILAFNSSGNSAASNTASVTTPAPSTNTPPAPTSLTASTVNATRINLAWVDNAGNESGFLVQQATNNTFTADLVSATTAANTTSYSVTGLSPSSTYYFRIFAFNSSGNSAASNTASVTTPAIPTQAPLIPHTTDGYTDCLACHSASSFRPFPTSHAGRTNSTCTTCHQTSGGTAPPRLSVGAPRIGHSITNRLNCRSCHGVSESLPRSHSGYQNIACLVCHRS